MRNTRTKGNGNKRLPELQMVPSAPPPVLQVPQTPSSLHKLPKPSGPLSIRKSHPDQSNSVPVNPASSSIFDIQSQPESPPVAQKSKPGPKSYQRENKPATFTARKFGKQTKPKPAASSQRQRSQRAAAAKSKSKSKSAAASTNDQPSPAEEGTPDKDDGGNTNRDLDPDSVKKPAIIHFSQDGPKNQGAIHKSVDGIRKMGANGGTKETRRLITPENEDSMAEEQLMKSIGLEKEKDTFQNMDELVNTGDHLAHIEGLMNTNTATELLDIIEDDRERAVDSGRKTADNECVVLAEDSYEYPNDQDCSSQLSEPPEVIQAPEAEQEKLFPSQRTSWAALETALASSNGTIQPGRKENIKGAKAEKVAQYETESSMGSSLVSGHESKTMPVLKRTYADRAAAGVKDDQIQNRTPIRRKRPKVMEESPSCHSVELNVPDRTRVDDVLEAVDKLSSLAGNSTPCPSHKEGDMLLGETNPPNEPEHRPCTTQDSIKLKGGSAAPDDGAKVAQAKSVSSVLGARMPNFHFDQASSDFSRKPERPEVTKPSFMQTLKDKAKRSESTGTWKNEKDNHFREAREAYQERQTAHTCEDTNPADDHLSIHSSSSSSSSSQAEEDATQTQELTDEMEWEASLRPELQDIVAVLRRVSDSILTHLSSNETALASLVAAYESDATQLVAGLHELHDPRLATASAAARDRIANLVQLFRDATSVLQGRAEEAMSLRKVWGKEELRREVADVDRRLVGYLEKWGGAAADR